MSGVFGIAFWLLLLFCFVLFCFVLFCYLILRLSRTTFWVSLDHISIKSKLGWTQFITEGLL